MEKARVGAGTGHPPPPAGPSSSFLTEAAGGGGGGEGRGRAAALEQRVEVLGAQLAEVRRSRDEEVALLHAMMKESRRIFSQAMRSRRP